MSDGRVLLASVASPATLAEYNTAHSDAAALAGLQGMHHQMKHNANVVRLQECSAKEDTSLLVMEMACDAFLHPTMPLFDHVKSRCARLQQGTLSMMRLV